MCEKCGETQPSFGLEDDNPTHCAKCKDFGMRDVKNKMCEKCGDHAYYNLPGLYPQFCSEHKAPGMIRDPRRKCENCSNPAFYGTLIPIHCDVHTHAPEYNLCEYTCTQCGRLDVINKNGICVNFCSLSEIDRAVKKRIKRKEEEIIKLLKSSIDSHELVEDRYDTQINSCDMYRPDICYHCGDHVVIIEVDENQHKSYTCQAKLEELQIERCLTPQESQQLVERTRMFLIASHFDLPTVFLRYNPDKYTVNSESTTISLKSRQDLLVKWVKKCIQHIPAYGCSVKYLFYNDFDQSDTTFQEITPENICLH